MMHPQRNNLVKLPEEDTQSEQKSTRGSMKNDKVAKKGMYSQR